MPADVRMYRAAPAPPKRLPPPTTLQVVQRWMSRHKALTAACLTFLLTGSVGALVYVNNKQYRRKRRAKKSASGARTDVVVIAGAVASPLTNALYMDLERRGFVVYVVTNTPDQEHYIRTQNRVDLLPLQLNLVDPYAAQEQLARFHSLLAREHLAFDEAEPHKLNFVGMIIVPDTQSTLARIDEISSEEWSDALNAKVLNTIATTQLFLPSITEHKAKILILTPSVTPSLKPPAHGIESTVYGALEGFTASLAAELKESGVYLSHFKLGNIDIPAITARQHWQGSAGARLKATPVRRLQDSVFDALVSRRPSRTWHVGRGSLAYDFIGNWMPASAVAWMMGVVRKSAPPVVEDMHGSEIESLTWEKIDQEGV